MLNAKYTLALGRRRYRYFNAIGGGDWVPMTSSSLSLLSSGLITSRNFRGGNNAKYPKNEGSFLRSRTATTEVQCDARVRNLVRHYFYTFTASFSNFVKESPS